MHTVFCFTCWTVLFRHDTDGICPCTSVDNWTVDAAAIWWVLVSAAASACSFISATAFFYFGICWLRPVVMTFWLFHNSIISRMDQSWEPRSVIFRSFPHGFPSLISFFLSKKKTTICEKPFWLFTKSRGTEREKKKKRFCQYNEIWIETDWQFPKTDWNRLTEL